MSEINSFSDYTSKYNSNIDFNALFGGTSDTASAGTSDGAFSKTLSSLVSGKIDKEA